MRTPLVIGNWKMNGSYAANMTLLTAMLPDLSGKDGIGIAVCPPFPYLGQIGQRLVGSDIQLGAQNVNENASGAYTGEVSTAMLREFGCEYVLVGHSERRSIYGESNQRVAAKFEAVSAGSLRPVLCVGETLEERENHQTETVIRQQLGAVLERCGIDGFKGAVVAYEPVWAIGTGQTASPEQAQDVHRFIRGFLDGRSTDVAQSLPILYGGSVKASNADMLFTREDVDGGLIGGAALDATQFSLICEALARACPKAND